MPEITPGEPRIETAPAPAVQPPPPGGARREYRPRRYNVKSRLLTAALYAGVVGLVWYLGFLGPQLAIGLGVIFVVSGLVPERWSSLTAGVLLLVGAALIYINYQGSGDRRLALLAAVLGVILVVYGAIRARADRL